MKRKREQMRAEKRRMKAARRAERSGAPKSRPSSDDGNDPDIAHIKPGPQRNIWEDEDFAHGIEVEEEEEKKDEEEGSE